MIAGPAHATTLSTCNGDAPGSFSTLSCNGMCTLNVSGSVITCTGTCNQGLLATAVTNYRNPDDRISIWGSCRDSGGNTDFCCVTESEPSTVAKVLLAGTAYVDDFAFTHVASGRALQNPTSTFLKGVQLGAGGDDNLSGSAFDGVEGTYMDFLLGEDGADEIYTLDGDDYASGGPGDDIQIETSDGNDVLWADAGSDPQNSGGPGDDCVIDKVGCPLGGEENNLGGQADNDILWVGKDGGMTCGDPTEWSADGGTGDDTCGDSDWDVSPGNVFDSCLYYVDEFSDIEEDCAVPSW